MRTFEIIPALDLAGGRVVRLVQGQFAAETVLRRRPGRARHADSGATARPPCTSSTSTPPAPASARPRTRRHRRDPRAPRPTAASSRSAAACATRRRSTTALALGVDRALVGTLAFRDPPALDRLVARHGDRICVTADALEGSVRVAGWQEDSGVDVVAAVRELAGPRRRRLPRHGHRARRHARRPRPAPARGRARGTDVLLLASGGIGSIDDLRAVRDVGADGVVVGRALLAGAFTLPEPSPRPTLKL